MVDLTNTWKKNYKNESNNDKVLLQVCNYIEMRSAEIEKFSKL